MYNCHGFLVEVLPGYKDLDIFFVAPILKSGPSGKLVSWVSHLCLLYHHSSFLFSHLSEDIAEHVG